MTSVFADIRPAPVPSEDPDDESGLHQPAPDTRLGLCGAAAIFAPLPPVHYLVEGVIPAGSLALLTGYGGDRKTWFALALANACATGSTWLGLKCTAGEAVVLDYENAFNSTKRRIQRLARGHGHTTPLSRLDLGRPRVSLSDKDFASTVEALLQERPNVNLLIIDTLRAACPGIDENASTSREHLDRLRDVAEQHGVVIVFLAHARKANMSTSSAPRRERIRGSSALFDAVDVVLDISAATNGDLSIQQTKGRESKEFLALNARLVDTPSGDIRLELITPTVGTVAPQGLGQGVLTAVGQHPGCSIASLLPVLQGRKQDVSSIVHDLLSKGLLVNQGSRKHFQLHLFPPVPAPSPGLYPSSGSPGGSPKGRGTTEPGDGSVPGTSGNHGNHGNHKDQYDA